MSGYAIIVTRADGRLQPVTLKDPDFEAVCRQAFRFRLNGSTSGATMVTSSCALRSTPC
jgi:hypothetical protein